MEIVPCSKVGKYISSQLKYLFKKYYPGWARVQEEPAVLRAPGPAWLQHVARVRRVARPLTPPAHRHPRVQVRQICFVPLQIFLSYFAGQRPTTRAAAAI